LGTDGTINLPNSTTGEPLIQSTATIQILANTSYFTFGTDGTLTFPDNTVQHTAYTGSTHWSVTPSVAGCPIYTELTPDHFQAYTQQSHLAFNNDGSWHLGSNYNGNGLYSNDNTATLYSNLGDVVIRTGDSSKYFTFGPDGSLTLPQTPGGAAVISGGANGVQVTANSHTWEFGPNGALVFPDTTQQTTAYIPGSGGVSINSGTNFASISTTTFTIETGKNSYWIAQFGDLMNNNETDYGNSVIYDSQGNVIVAVTDFTESASYPQPLVVKYDPQGNILWKQLVGIIGSAESLDVDSSDNIYLLINDYDAVTSRVFQLDPTGALTNQIDVTGTDEDMYDIVVDGSGNFYVTGYGTNTSTNQLTVFKGNFSGISWQQGINFTAGQNDYGYSIALDGASPPNVYAFGNSDANGSELVKLDNNGNVLWSVGITGAGVYGNAVSVDSAGNSYTVSAYGDDYTAVVAKYDTNGNLVWQVEMAYGTHDPTEIQLGDDGYLYITGLTNTGPYNKAIWVAKMDTNGNLQWTNALSNFFNYEAFTQWYWNGHKDIAVRNGMFAITAATENPANINTSTSTVPYQMIIVQFPTDGTYASPSFSTAKEYQGYAYFNTPWLESTSTAALTLNTATFVTGNPGFATDASTATLVASTLTGNVTGIISSPIWQFNNSGNIVFPDGTQQSTAYPGEGSSNIGEYQGLTSSTGSYYTRVGIAIKNASGYNRVVGLTNSAQTWLSLADVAKQLGIYSGWISGMIIDYNAFNVGLGNNGNMVGQIIMAVNYNNMSVTHLETAISTNSSDNYVFSNLSLWELGEGSLQAIRTDNLSGQQLDIIWTAKVFINPSESFC